MIGLHSCLPKRNQSKALDMVAEKEALMQADEKFSDLSMKKGMKNAFIEYMDGDGVLLRPNKLPIIGAQAIDYLIQQNDTAYKLHWKPQEAFVSKSADLGYTYGVYALQPNTQDTIIYGTYVSIWKKQDDGSWKFVLDTGNEGTDDN
jgi:ketosteroid isomerase-like protein